MTQAVIARTPIVQWQAHRWPPSSLGDAWPMPDPTDAQIVDLRTMRVNSDHLTRNTVLVWPDSPNADVFVVLPAWFFRAVKRKNNEYMVLYQTADDDPLSIGYFLTHLWFLPRTFDAARVRANFRTLASLTQAQFNITWNQRVDGIRSMAAVAMFPAR